MVAETHKLCVLLKEMWSGAGVTVIMESWDEGAVTDVKFLRR